jgi:hypothetical protein
LEFIREKLQPYRLELYLFIAFYGFVLKFQYAPEFAKVVPTAFDALTCQ